MTPREYLRQADFLENRIRFALTQVEEVREASHSVRSPGYEERHDPNRPHEAGFVKRMEKTWELEGKAAKKLQMLYDLKEQMQSVIFAVEDPGERLVLEYRYLYGMSWEEIADELCANTRTVRRWHEEALKHVVVPKNAIRI